MKKLLLVLWFLSVSINAQAQDPILFEYDWQLIEVRIDGASASPPSNDEVGLVYLYFGEFAAPNDILTEVCNVLIADADFPNPEEVIFFNMAQTLIECTIPTNSIFENNYFNFFFEAIDEVLVYTIGILDDPPDGDLYNLVIENADGDYVSYFSSPLSTSEFDLNKTVLYPNPAASTLQWQLPIVEINKARIFSLDGRLLISEAVQDSQVNVAALPTGVYFLELSGPDGQVVKRFVKQ